MDKLVAGTASAAPNLQHRLANLQEHAARLQKASYRAENLTDKLAGSSPKNESERSINPAPTCLDDSIEEILRNMNESIIRLELAIDGGHRYVGNFIPEPASDICKPAEPRRY